MGGATLQDTLARLPDKSAVSLSLDAGQKAPVVSIAALVLLAITLSGERLAWRILIEHRLAARP